MLCLSLTCHDYFGDGHFVLEPLGDPLQKLTVENNTPTKYDVRFSWVPQYRTSRRLAPGQLDLDHLS